jgi:hypothetical protein
VTWKRIDLVRSGISSSNSNVIGSGNEIAEKLAYLAVINKIAGVFLIGLHTFSDS